MDSKSEQKYAPLLIEEKQEKINRREKKVAKSSDLRKFKRSIFHSHLNEVKNAPLENLIITDSKQNKKEEKAYNLDEDKTPEIKQSEAKRALEEKLVYRVKKLNEKITNIEAFQPRYFTGDQLSVKEEVHAVSLAVTRGLHPYPQDDQVQATAALEQAQAFSMRMDPVLRKAELHLQLAQIDKQVLDIQENNYHSLMKNERRVKRQIKLLLNRLLKEQFDEVNNENEKRKLSWLNLYALACMMEAFHEAYSEETKKQEYIKLKNEIKAYLEKGKGAQFRRENEESFKRHVRKKLDEAINYICNLKTNLKEFFSSTTKIRNLLGFLNIWRIYWIFARSSIVSGLQNASIINAIMEFERAFHSIIPIDIFTNSDFAGIISIIKAPRHAYDLLSIGLFTARFAIDIVTSIKHMYKPTELELDARGVVSKILAEKIQANDLVLRTAIFNQFGISPENFPVEANTEWFQKQLALKKPFKKGVVSNEQIKGLLKNIEEEVLSKEPNHAALGLLHEYKEQLDLKVPLRRKHERYKRGPRMANDGAWTFTNFLCNYDYITGFTDPVGIGLTAVFLVFDMGVHCWNWYRSYQDYKDTKIELKEEIRYYTAMQEQNRKEAKDIEEKIELYKELLKDSREETNWLAIRRNLHLEQRNKQQNEKEAEYIQLQLDLQEDLKKENEIEYRVNLRTSVFLITAALILAVGFTLAVPVSPVIFYLICTFAVAMYLSADSFTKYKEKSLHYDDIKKGSNKQAIAIARLEYEKARKDFCSSLFMHTVAPVFLITAYSVCWPLAVISTLMLAGYGFWRYKSNHNKDEVIRGMKNSMFKPTDKLEEEEREVDAARNRTLSVKNGSGAGN